MTMDKARLNLEGVHSFASRAGLGQVDDEGGVFAPRTAGLETREQEGLVWETTITWSVTKMYSGVSNITEKSSATDASLWARPLAARSWAAASMRCLPVAGPGPTTTTSQTRRPSTC